MIFPRRSERGLSLVEALASSLIAVITVIGLAYSFATGRGLVDRYEIYRAASAVAQLRLEQLVRQPGAGDMTIGVHPAVPNNFVFNGQNRGTETWTVSYINDPYDGTSDADSTDLKRVVALVRWTTNGRVDSVAIARLYRVK